MGVLTSLSYCPLPLARIMLCRDTFTPEEQERKRGIELNNGRAAQMGILGLMVHEELPSHDPYVINELLGYPIDFNAGY